MDGKISLILLSKSTPGRFYTLLNADQLQSMAAHKRLQTMASSGAAGTSSQDCSICLSSIAVRVPLMTDASSFY